MTDVIRIAKQRREAVSVEIVRTIDDFLRVVAVRSLVYMGEQRCPYEEELDGNDLCGATHLIARIGAEPVGTVRLRWFADFAKIERVAVQANHRSGRAASALVSAALELAARKGYRKVLGHIQARLLRYWKRSAGVSERPGRKHFTVSDYDYVEIERDLARHPRSIDLNTPALVLLRPEGDWDRPGVLDRSTLRAVKTTACA